MCTDQYRLHSLVHLFQELVAECTDWYWPHSLVHLLQQLVTECTDWLATQSCTLASTYWLQVYQQGAGCTVFTVQCFTPTGYKKKKKEKKKIYIYTSSCLNSWVTPTYQFCRLQRFTGYRKLSVTETWYLTELPKVILVIENC